MRHGLTDQGSGSRDIRDINFESCEGYCNLSSQGRSQALGIGVAIRYLEIPICGVWSSPYCRTKDSAQRAFGRYEIVNNLRLSFAMQNSVVDLLV